MRAALVILIVCFASIALADDFKTISGKEYKNATVTQIDPDGLSLRQNREFLNFISKNCPKMFSSALIMTRKTRLHFLLSKLLLTRPQIKKGSKSSKSSRKQPHDNKTLRQHKARNN